MFNFEVCIITYNRSRQLADTLNNVLEQVSNDVVISVLNNASSDDTEQLLEFFCANRKNFNVYNSKENLGVSKGREFLWRKSKAKFILSLDDDIIIKDISISFMLDVIIRCKDVGIVSPDIIDSVSMEVINPLCSRKYKLPTFYEACFLIRADIFNNIGFFDSKLKYAGEGMDYALRIEKSGYKVCRLHDISVIHYDRPRDCSESLERRIQWVWSFSYVYWKNLSSPRAFFWSSRNLISHIKSGMPLFGPSILFPVILGSIQGALAGYRLR